MQLGLILNCSTDALEVVEEDDGARSVFSLMADLLGEIQDMSEAVCEAADLVASGQARLIPPAREEGASRAN